jgi:hypothetical protein
MQDNSDVTVICGHYGSGKTNLAMNLALESAQTGRRTVVMDMDIVNPYFRSSEYKAFLEKNNIELIAPTFANTTLDTPVLPAEIYSIFEMDNTSVFIDVGGDDAGATALGRISGELSAAKYNMLYVVNCNRILSREPIEAAELLREIETASRLKASGIVNNSHMGVDSSYDVALASVEFAEKVSEYTQLPLLYSTITDFALGNRAVPDGFKKVKRLVLFPWELDEAIN